MVARRPTQLFERWAKEREAAAGTVENWQYFFGKMEEHFKDRSAASITRDGGATVDHQA